MATNELWMKLLINTKTGKLCLAEAGHNVVEFLTGLLSLLLGTVTSLLAKESMAGSVRTLLGSAEKLGANYNIKEQRLSPAVAPATLSCLQRLLGIQNKVEFYRYAGSHGDMIIDRFIAVRTKPIAPTTLPMPTYTIKDDLSMTAASMSVITLLTVVMIGREEALGILGAAFKSSTVLTDVFLPKENAGGKREAPVEVEPKKNTRCKTDEVIQI